MRFVLQFFLLTVYFLLHLRELHTLKIEIKRCMNAFFFQSLDKHGLFSHTSNGVQFFCDGSLCHGLKGRP